MKTTTNQDIKTELDRAHAIDPAIQAMLDYLHGSRTGAMPSPSWFTNPEKISLELLVKTAAAVRPITDSERDAVEMALRLIDLSERSLEFSREQFERKRGTALKLTTLGLEGDAPIPYRAGIRIITGQSRAERADEDFLLLLEALEEHHPAPTQDGVHAYTSSKQAVGARIAGFEEDGFAIEHLVWLQKEYITLRDRGQLGKKRRPGKKRLAGKSASKPATNRGKPATKKCRAAGK